MLMLILEILAVSLVVVLVACMATYQLSSNVIRCLWAKTIGIVSFGSLLSVAVTGAYIELIYTMNYPLVGLLGVIFASAGIMWTVIHITMKEVI